MNQGDRIGDYVVIELIGVGGQAEVALAECVSETHPTIPKGMRVALKKFYYQAQSERSNELFMERARLLLDFDHPNLIHYYDFFMHGEQRPEKCLVMEYIDGETMREWLTRWNPEEPEHGKPLKGFAWEDASACIQHVIEGLIYARNCGFTHRDIKPDNIVIAKDGSVKVLDFDIARMADDHRTHRSKSRNMTPIAYMAPEFLDASFMGDEQSDILSLGVTLYEALCGDTYCAQNDAGMYGLALNQPALDDYVLPGIQALLSKAIEPSRQKRYQTLEEFRADIKKITRRSIRGQQTTYRLMNFIKHGGFGAVYQAECASTGTPVAVKKLMPPRLNKLAANDHRIKFKREADLLYRTNHPHIVRYLEAIDMDTDSDPFLVMEYLPGMPGTSLSDRIRKQGKLPAVYTASLFISYLDALHHLHTNGIIHRDISPDNLYAPDDPHSARIFDLGVARNAKATMTSGKLATKLQYAAPEFHRERGSAMTDVYSLALCLYEALTGTAAYPLPGDQEKALELFRDRMMNPKSFTLDIDGAPEINRYPEMTSILEQACHPDARKRFQSAAAMKAQLMKFVRTHGGSADADPQTQTNDTLTSMTRMPDGKTETVAVDAAFLEERIRIPAEEELTSALEQAHTYERKLLWRRIFRGLGKAAIVLLLTGMIAAGSWYGPSYLQRLHMQRYINGFTPLPEAALVQELVDRYATCEQWEAKDKLPWASPWTAWKHETEKQLGDIPTVFSTALSKAPGQLETLAEQWRKTKPIWEKKPFNETHVSKWNHLMATMDFALYVKDLQTGKHETADDLNRKIEEISQLQSRYPEIGIQAGVAANEALNSAIKTYYQNLVDQAGKVATNESLSYPDKIAAIEELSAGIRRLQNRAVEQQRQYEKDLARIANAIPRPVVRISPDLINAAINSITAETDKLRRMAVDDLLPSDLASALQVLIKHRPTASDNNDVKGTAAILDFKTLFIEKGIALLGSNNAPGQRQARLQAMQNLISSTDFNGTFLPDERGDLPVELARQQQRFVLALDNNSGMSARMNAPYLQPDPDQPLPTGASTFVFSGISNIIPVEVVVTPGKTAYQPVSLAITLLPGSGTTLAIKNFEPKPVKITLRNDVLTPPVKAEYQINEGGWITTAIAQTITNIVPPAKIDVRFERKGYLPARIEASRNVAIGASELDIPCPAVTEWSKIPDEIPWEKTLEKALSDTKPLFEKAESLVQEDLAWAMQVMELDLNGTSVLAPRFRKAQQPIPGADWPGLKAPLQAAEQTLQQLQSTGDKQKPENLATLTTTRTWIAYYLIWAEHRNVDPSSVDFLSRLNTYKGDIATDRQARFAHSVFAKPEDRATIGPLGIGLADFHRWRAHRDYREFNESGLARLESLNTFAERHPINEYDLRAGFLLTYLTWTVNSVLQDIERHERDPLRNNKLLRISDNSRDMAKLAASRLQLLIKSANDTDRQNAIRYLEQLAAGNIKTEPCRAAIVLLAVIPGLSDQTYATQIGNMDQKYQTLIAELKKL